MKAIVACANNRAIGKDNQLLFRIPEDLQHFKDKTTGHVLVMGRKTFDSLPNVLPGRRHFVLTRDHSYTIDHPQVDVFYEFDELLDTLLNMKENEVPFYIIGGGSLYKQFTPYIDEVWVTHVPVSKRGDTYFDFPLKDFFAIERHYYQKNTRRSLPFEIVQYVRHAEKNADVKVYYK